jgi:hypothetical protein
MPDNRLTAHAGRFRAAPEPMNRIDREDQLPDLAPAAAAPEAWLESEPAWLIAVLK